MLQLKKISKRYQTGDLIQTALENVDLNLRDNEFVAILGPSGSGKTTLLNIIGGLDRYDSGDLIINSISTQKYKDRDWDSYRNHTIGFVFQSYNLIPHQNILSNVELALTISGISRSERKRRAKEALEQVGLGDQTHKRPNQLSGGQMQRVAIARALVNNPDILLADEPTGALDTDTSIQVMELLKEVAKNRLVVMVTHNPELAEQYSTRIVKLRDGKIIDDSNPFEVESKELGKPEHKSMGRSSMSFLTSLSLSFNNLRTKKARTILTSFAGSIGIIGIALILSLSNGVNTYITDIQKSTMTSYPISIQERTVDLNGLIGSTSDSRDNIEHKLDGVYANGQILEMQSSMTSSITSNNLTEFKKYLDDPNSEIHKYVGENGIIYSYAPKFDVYTYDRENILVNTDGSTLPNIMGGYGPMSSMGGMNNTEEINALLGLSANNFEELLCGANGELISPVVTDSYECIYGDWPTKYNQVVLVLDKNNEIDATAMYELGLLPSSQYKEIINKIKAGEKIDFVSEKLDYKDICEKEFYLIPACDTFEKGENDKWYSEIKKNSAQIEGLFNDAIKIEISGIIRHKDGSNYSAIVEPIGYTKALTDHLINYTDNSDIVKYQKENPDTNILSGVSFSPADDAAKVADAKNFVKSMGISDKAALFKGLISQMSATNPQMAEQLLKLGEAELAATFDTYIDSAPDTVLLSLYDKYISTGSYSENMDSFGLISRDAPSSISIYADSFENKDAIANCIQDYNKTVDDVNKITYTDAVGLLMSSITTIVNVISYILIAFVSVSLVVSSIMIGIITYISVLERTKEIGILRAIGASKRNITRVFNAETFIIGLCAGLLGVTISALFLIPVNLIIHAVSGISTISAILPVGGAIILVILSIVLTLIGGIIPSKKAAKKDPVIALRTE